MLHLIWVALKGDGEKVVKNSKLKISERQLAVDNNGVTGKMHWKII